MPTGDPPPGFGGYLYGKPVWGVPWDGMITPDSVTFTSGSSHILPSGELYILASGEHPSVSITDDLIPANENPPFPGWDQNTQVVRFTDENGVIGVAASYHSLAIGDDLELDPEDFNMRSAEIVVDARAGVIRGAVKSAIEKALRESMRIRELGDEIERLQAEIRRLEFEKLSSSGVPAPPPVSAPSSPWELAPPYTEKMWEKSPIEKKPIVKEEGWARDPIFASLASELDSYPSTVHDDNVDAVRMSFRTMIRKAVGLNK